MKLRRNSGAFTLAVGSALASGVLVLAACGSGGGSRTSGRASAAASPAATAAIGVACGQSATVPASGSTAQEFAMRFWIKNYMRACPGTRITYDGNGSGAGQNDFLKGATAFAGSDSALSAAQITRSKSVCSHGGHAVHLPAVGAPIAIAYNLPGVSKLVLDAPTLARIFDSQITKWNDPAIAKLNPGTRLPATPIQASHRSDSSGTTDNFTSYLSAADPSAWPYGHNKEWAAKGGQSAKGSTGLAEQVKKTVGAIGYVELTHAIARNIPTVSIATGASAPVASSVLTASKAIADAKIAGTGDDDLVLQLDYTTKAPGAYPIDMVTYEIVCDKGNEPATWSATKAFLTYITDAQGQQDLSFQGYATLPATIVNKVRSKISNLS
ncbi:Phosphate-binding protein PstS 2 [Streptomyces sp. RB17]|uniref:phosphate ABC transporter substrate-binding protein PstS n=1 Tax=Streptomyces sp. RB17 TaxID=2585197 RepID=UPI0012950E9D|nr:phosphate ABC transporter substrate-binding protein PstS [Streptomyces sp. RB17]MQY33459.1 Phosphate-binding protein PstS 2 [Streptomyces sp. RB17]